MSSLIVTSTKIREIRKHPEADNLEIAICKGWQVVIPKNKYKNGDLVIFVPLDSILPVWLSDHLGVTKYLGNQRVCATRLRGQISHGLIIPNKLDIPGHINLNIKEENIDVAKALGITKDENRTTGFLEYTDIENINNYPDVLKEGENVWVTEKIHGTNTRFSFVFDEKEEMWNCHCGSREIELSKEEFDTYRFSRKFHSKLENLFKIKRPKNSIIIFGETYGYKIQKLNYGLSNISFKVFDVCIDGKYLNYNELISLFDIDDIVPILYNGKFSMEKMKEICQGKTTMMDKDPHVMEGIIIRPHEERNERGIGRVIVKMINDEYLSKKAGRK